MATGKSRDTNTSELRIRNANMRLKREIINIAKSEGVTYSFWCRMQLAKIVQSYPDNARNYSDDDGS